MGRNASDKHADLLLYYFVITILILGVLGYYVAK
ncbi:MAG: hypothetical protein KCHDKBKB_00662 [Elusimicrobia bacterium]|nr:hypothetical protein [Elusimicrobiota bacterium]